MKQFKSFDRANTFTAYEELPRGGYVLEIKDASVISGQYGETLVLSFDIAEGDKEGFYARNYKSQTGEDKKWKGTFRLSIPADDGSERDQWRVKAFNTAIVQIEDSNPGYQWDWDEAKLKGKKVGGLFNKKEYDFNGRHGFFTQCKRLASVEGVRNGEFKIPDDDLLTAAAAPQTDASGFLVPDSVSDDDLPFN